MTDKPNKGTQHDATSSDGEDVALLCGRSGDGQGVNVLRKRGDAFEAGVVRPLEDGKPIAGEVVQLTPRGQSPLCDVQVCYSPPAPPATTTPATAAPSTPTPPQPRAKADDAKAASRGHPPQVASDEYRKNWDAIWKSQRAQKKYLN